MLGKLIGAVGGSFISKGIDSIFGKSTADTNYEYERRFQKHDQEFQKEMRATAYQTAVDDMQKAGINPAVAFASGSGDTYSGSSSHGTVAMQTPTGGNLAQNLSAISTTALTNAQKENIEADTKLKEKQSGKTETEIELNEIQKEFQEELNQAEINLKQAQTKKEIAEARNATAETIKNEMINTYNKIFGTNADQSILERIATFAYDLVYKFPRQGTNWVANEAINFVKNLKAKK